MAGEVDEQGVSFTSLRKHFGELAVHSAGGCLLISQEDELICRHAFTPEVIRQLRVAAIRLRKGREVFRILPFEKTDDENPGSFWLPIAPLAERQRIRSE